MTFKVQRRMCSTCIYRPDSPLDLAKLEDEVRDRYGGFRGHRVCHHSDNVCCRGFWEAHKNEFSVGQVAQRLGMVEFVEADTLADKAGTRKRRPASALPAAKARKRCARSD